MSLRALLCAALLAAAAAAAAPHFFPFPRGPAPQWAEEPERQVVRLPALLPREAQEAAGPSAAAADVPLPYSFDAFGRNFQLQLVPNRRLLAPHFRVWSERGPEPAAAAAAAGCHYLHAGPGVVAALSACRDHALHGLIMTDNSTYEVRPLAAGAARAEGDGRTPHVISRAGRTRPPPRDAVPLRARRPRARRTRPPPDAYTVEIALFLDPTAYGVFHPFFNHNDDELRDMLLAYINGVQALYQHASLGTNIQFSLVRLTLLRAAPPGLPGHAERGRLLDSFCAYQRQLNVDDDADPDHWDMALLLSGLDFYSEEGGRRNGVTMGLAPVGGVCLPAHACVVAEFGARDDLGRLYPSAGFTSVYILAHEIGHNLGMHHDGVGNACARDGFIMSPSRGTSGEAAWSACSAQVAKELEWATCLFDAEPAPPPPELDHGRYDGAPGLALDAKRQCEVLLRDRSAEAVPRAPSAAHCHALTCRSPRRPGETRAGPALPGTRCGPHMWCQGGECVQAERENEIVPMRPAPTTTPPPPPPPPATSPPPAAPAPPAPPAAPAHGWSPWRDHGCRSGCSARSRGHRERRRTCAPRDRCDGPAYDVMLCDDTKVCGKKSRVSAGELASRLCADFALALPELDPRGAGLQAPHDPTRMWMGCAVFCRRAAGGGYYAPRAELNQAGRDPYFPDGTWCHNDGQQNYYCLQHHCLPETFKMAPAWQVWELDEARSRSGRPVAGPVAGPVGSGRGPRAPLEPAADPEQQWEVQDYVDTPTGDSPALDTQ